MILCLKDCRDDGTEPMKPAPKPPPIGTNRAYGKTTLSPRQKQVLELVSQGMMDKEIAVKLGISEDTVGEYLDAVFRRFKVHSRTGLMARLLQDQPHP